MKKSIIYALILSLGTAILSCTEKKIAASDVPQPVVAAFNMKYPGAADVQWEKEKKEGKVIYGAEFKMNDKKKEAEFEENGNFVEEK